MCVGDVLCRYSCTRNVYIILGLEMQIIYICIHLMFCVVMCVLCSLPPTSLLPGAAYHDLGKAFLGEGLLVSTPPQLRRALTHAFSRERTTKRRGKPLVINVIIDPYSSRKPQVREKN